MKRLVCLLIFALCFFGCGNGSLNKVAVPTANPLKLSYLATIPTQDGEYSSAYVELLNDSSTSLTQIGFRVEDVNNLVDNSIITNSECANLNPHQTCQIKLTVPPITLNGSFILRVQAMEDQTHMVATQQIINYAKLPVQNGVQVESDVDISNLAPGAQFTLAIPIRSLGKLSQLSRDWPASISKQNLQCENGNNLTYLNAGQMCTWIISGQVDKTTTDNLSLNGINSDEVSQTVAISLNITTTAVAVLVDNQANIQLVANGTSYQKVTLLNTGLANATNITINKSSLMVTPESNTCTGVSISPNAGCSFNLSLNSQTSGGNDVFTVNYFNGVTTKTLAIRYVYLGSGTQITPSLTFSKTNNLSGAWIYSTESWVITNGPQIESNEESITINNNGNVTLTNLAFSSGSNISPLTINSTTCSTTLASGASCVYSLGLNINYAEESSQSFVVRGSYIESNGSLVSYARNLVIPYSTKGDRTYALPTYAFMVTTKRVILGITTNGSFYYKSVFQGDSDGNLVVYQANNPDFSNRTAIYAWGAVKDSQMRLTWQTDGNLIYSTSTLGYNWQVRHSSGVTGSNSKLILESSGAMVIYNSQGILKWQL